MSDARADIIRVLHRAYVDNGWVPPTLDGYADALLAAGYGKVDGDKVRTAILDLCADADEHSFTRQNGFLTTADVRAVIAEPSA